MKGSSSKKHIGGIGQSLIASILFLLIFEPIIQIGKDFTSKGLIALVDYFYYSCGHASGIAFLSTLSVYALTVFICHEIISIIKTVKAAFPKGKERKKPHTDSRESNSENKSDSIVVLSREIEKLERKTKTLDRIMIGLVIVSIMCYMLFFLNAVVYQCLPVLVKESFNRSITQITPYVESEQIDLLKSNWANMKSKDDYEVIQEEIDCILIENSLKSISR